MKKTSVFLVMIIGILFFFESGLSQWSTNPSQNLQILSNSIKPRIVADGDGGVIVVSESFTVNPLLYTQRVDRYGNILWDPSLRGIRVTTAGDEQAEALVVSDGEGGAYVGFNARTIIGYRQEPPEPIYSSRVRIQRLDANGNLVFGAQGITLFDYPIDSTEGGQGLYALVSGDSGGVYALWGDGHGPEGVDAYVNQVSPDGRVSWKNSVALKILFPSKGDFIPYPDGESGLNIYYQPRGSSLSHRFIRINRNGEVILDKPIDTGLTGFYLFSAVAGECILFWQDFNQFGLLDTLRCQKIDRYGEKLWGEKPVIVDSTGQLSTPLSIGRLDDGNGGAYFVYRKENANSGLVHIGNKGEILLKKNLTRFNGMGWNRQECIVHTNNGGVLYSVFQPNVGHLACAIDFSGQELWPSVLHTNRERWAEWDELISDGNNGVIFAWHEILPVRGTWIQQVSGAGRLGVVTSIKGFSDRKSSPRNIELFPPYPNPFNGSVRIVYQIPQGEIVFVKIYDLSGKEVNTLVKQQQAVGRHEVIWDGRDQYGHPVSSGVYFYQLSAGTHKQRRKLILLR